MPGDDCEVRALPRGLLDSTYREPSYGFSVDMGSSTLRTHLVHIPSKTVVAGASVDSPLNTIGLDVVTRLRFAAKNADARKTTVFLLRRGVRSLLETALASAEVSHDDVGRILVAGNTAVHHLFFDYPTDTLLEAPYRAQRRGAVRVRAGDVNLPFVCDVWSPPIVESYVGSDLVSVLVELEHRPVSRPTLVMDVGVNTEIAVLTDEGTWVSSAPSGPAFEGMSMECGVPARTGAITDVRIEIDRKGANIGFETLGNDAPIGISGCGAVSLVAEMVRRGIVTRDGSLSLRAPAVTEVGGVKRFTIVPQEQSARDGGIYLTQVDLRMLQLSKAAVAAAVMTVLRHARLRPEEVRTMVLAGAFGAYLSLADATEIGLLPSLAKPQVLRIPEVVLEGLDRMLTDEDARARSISLASSISYVDLSSDEEFDVLLARLRLFAPLSVDEFRIVE
ncbi:MAG: hypothetical protein DRO73_02015 [Candidatus Thorarchaeota archaeon]|nr:MAG: hypothetical protein DRO73_02015 [Candidatus Thorarchaeota archaeon]RLI59431.1 MAG: hypothetical protein DRO93_08410 [Candidatus Thorarchaeota archaeon]